jgi:deoxyribonuclease V
LESMTPRPLTIAHPWDLTPREAIALQKRLAGRVIRTPGIEPDQVSTIAGVDSHYRNGMVLAAVVVLKLPNLEWVEDATAVRRATFPYIPGLLSFREGPVILEAFNALTSTPDVLIFDGQGIAHPRRFGIASHIGLLLDLPAIGCAKTRLTGHYQEPAFLRGSYSYLVDRDETVGAVVRTRSGVKSLFVSIGHRLGLQESIELVLCSCSKFRLPEASRRADQLARKEAHSV